MSTLADFRREMLARAPGLGQVVSLTAVAAQSMTAARLATGESAARYINKWLLRPEAATASAADRERLCSAFDTATGKLTHAGAAYSDTTVGTEKGEILEYPARFYDNAIDVTLRRLRRIDRETFATGSGKTRYSLADLDWVTEPGDVLGISSRHDRVLSHDRYLQKWNRVSSLGILQPDWWTLAGTDGTATRSSDHQWRGRDTVKITRSGVNVTLSQPVTLLLNGTPAANGEDLRGKTVTAVGVGWAADADLLRFAITDGVTTSRTSYHSGGSTFEELTVSIDVAATAGSLSIQAEVNDADASAYVAECYAVENTLTDVTRRDTAEDVAIAPPWDFDQGTGPLAVNLPQLGRGQQYVFSTTRAYPGFDATRLAAGTADADTSDAPLVPVAVGAIARLYEAVAELPGQDGERARRLGAEWEAKWQTLAQHHLYREETTRGGADLPRMNPLAPMARSGWWR